MLAKTEEDEPQGTPQGGVISPLLANIYLNPLDWLMERCGFEMVRYADDMVVLCRSQEEAETALEKLREWMDGAGLTVHPEKTRTVDMNVANSHFDFLGYRFKRSRGGKMMRLVRPKSLSKLRESIRTRTRRANGRSMNAIVVAKAAVMAPTINAGPTATSRNLGSSACLMPRNSKSPVSVMEQTTNW